DDYALDFTVSSVTKKFKLTPGAANNHPHATYTALQQKTYPVGDLNFDGVIDCDDRTVADSLLNVDFTSISTEGHTWNAARQLREQNTTDNGAGGNANAVTQSDINTYAAAFFGAGKCATCAAPLMAAPRTDLDGDGVVSVSDVLIVVSDMLSAPV